MKLTDQIQKTLEASFSEVIVIDNRGDGHFVEILCIDNQFAGKALLAKSRIIFGLLKPFESKVHAWSVKGFSLAEWEATKDEFKPQIYKHHR